MAVNDRIPVWQTLTHGLVYGLMAGLFVGAVEVLVLVPNRTVTALALLTPAMIFYAAAWAIVALVVAIVAWVVGVADSAARLDRVLVSTLVTLAILIVGGGYLNLRCLPAASDPRSIIANIVLLIACVPLARWLAGASSPMRWLTGVGRAMTVIALTVGASAGAAKIRRAGAEHSAATTKQAAEHANRPNVILITLDALRPDHLSAYGYARETSPELDAIAKDGVLFTHAYANSSWTRASVATMFTSLYPSTHGVNGLGTGIASSLTILPEAMKAAGYTTGIFSANAFISPVFGYDQGVDRFHHKPPSMFNELIFGHIARKLVKHARVFLPVFRVLQNLEMPGPTGRRVATRAEGLIGAFFDWAQGVHGQPFFAYIHFMESHTPYDSPEQFRKKFVVGDHGPLPTDLPPFDGFEPFTRAEPLPADRRDLLITQYDGGIAAVDHAIGELVQWLKARGIYDNTVIMVTADHGEEFYEHGGWGHGKSLYNVLLHVPLIVHDPVHPAHGRRIELPVRHIDLMPTILELAGAPRATDIEGRSWVPLVADASATEEPRVMYSEVFHEASYAHALQQGQWKLIDTHSHEQHARELFNLEQDPDEQHPLDVAADANGARLAGLLETFEQKTQRSAVAAEEVTIDGDMKERLRSLGYVQ